MDEGRDLRAALEAAQAEVKRLTRELALARGSSPKERELADALAHLKKSARERADVDAERLESHRQRERELRDDLDAAHLRIKKLEGDAKKFGRVLERLEKLERSRPSVTRRAVAAVTAVTQALQPAAQRRELDDAKREIVRLNLLLSRQGGRRGR